MKLVGVLLVALSVSSLAHADDLRAAREAYREGKRYYDLGEYKKALESFKLAYMNSEDPTLLFNIAQSYRLLGDKVEAIRAFRSFLRNLPNAPNAGEVRTLVAALEEALAKENQSKAIPPSGMMMSGGASEPPPKNEAPVEVAPSSPPEAAPVVPAPVVVAQPKEHKPKKWVWGVVGGAIVVVGVGLGVGLGLGLSSVKDPNASFGSIGLH